MTPDYAPFLFKDVRQMNALLDLTHYNYVNVDEIHIRVPTYLPSQTAREKLAGIWVLL